MTKEMQAATVYAAVNRHSVDLHTHLSQSLEQAVKGQSSLFLYALIDCAFNEQFIRRIRTQHPSAQPVSLYAETELDELRDVSPVLVQLPHNDDARTAWVNTLLQLADGMPMLSFLASPLEAHALAAHFFPFLKSETEDGQRFLLRLADTRVLPHLISVLDDAQHVLLPPISQWWSIDRMGGLQELRLPKTSEDIAILHTNRLKLSDLQFAALIDAAEADAVIEQLLLIVPEKCSPFRPGELHVFVSQQLEHAYRFGIESNPDLIAYCVGALNSQGKLHENLRASVLLNERRWQPGDLASALAELPEECWSPT